MLRNIVALVLLLNLALASAIWAVNTGRWVWPDAWRGEVHEPERLTRQLNADAIVLKLLKPGSNTSSPPIAPLSLSAAAVSAAAAASAPTLTPAANAKPLCLVSLGNEAAQSAKLNSALKDALPNVNVQTSVTREGGFWMVYLGKYPDAATVNKKFAEVEKLNIPGDYAILRDTPFYQPGISLGTFREKENANLRLAEVTKKGVKTARVVERVPSREVTSFKLPELDSALREKANDAVIKAGGKPLELCPSA